MNQSSIRGSWNSLRMSRNGWLPLALAALWVAGGNDRPIAQVGGGYTLVTLPSMETAWDVNDAGQAVGLWTNPAYPGSRGYVWTPTDGMLPMPVHSEDADRFPLPGNNGHRGVSINASGTIAGTARGIDGSQFRAATLTPSGVLTQDSEPFGDVSRASHAINAAGTVVGRYQGNGQVGFVWSPGQSMQLVGADAADINDAGQVVGYVGQQFNAAYVWSPTAGAQLLPKLAAAPSSVYEARAINNAGTVVGRYYDGTTSGLFLWSAATDTVDLNAPAGLPEYVDINDSGHVVATINGGATGFQAYLYRDGTWTNLNDFRPAGSTFLIQRAMAINNFGWIVGDGGALFQSGLGFVLIPPSENRAPVAQSGAIAVTEDFPASGQVAATDADGNLLTYALASNGTLGSVTITDATTGAFTYTPLPDANGVDAFTFIANDGRVDSNAATVTVTITPTADLPVLAWSAPSAIVYGTPLSQVQLNATADVPGTFAYSPPAGTVLSSGTQELSVIFTPGDTTNYTTSATSVSITVAQAAATVTLNNLTQNYTGSPLGPTVTTVPSGLAVSLTGAPQTNPGTYPVSATVTNPNYVGTASATFSIVALSARVVSPNGGERLTLGAPTTISWTATGATTVDVALSRDGGASYSSIPGCSGLSGIATTCAWTPTGGNAARARIRVTARAGTISAQDISDGVFQVKK